VSGKLLLLALVTLAGCGGQAASTQGQPGGQLGDEGNLLPPVVLGGAGNQETYAFHLSHGTYKVTWSATPPTSAGCSFSAQLKTGDTLIPVTEGRVEGAQQQPGAKEVGELQDAQYTMVVTTECAWRMAVTAH
jgi:hypothetical protein